MPPSFSTMRVQDGLTDHRRKSYGREMRKSMQAIKSINLPSPHLIEILRVERRDRSTITSAYPPHLLGGAAILDSDSTLDGHVPQDFWGSVRK
jgi:hypothetical protein